MARGQLGRYVPPYLLEQLWGSRELHASSAIVLHDGVVELAVPTATDVVVANYRDLERWAQERRIRPMPSWDGFVELAIHLSLRLPELDQPFPDSDNDVATAAQHYRTAHAGLITAVRTAYRRGCTVSGLASTVGVSSQQIITYLAADGSRPHQSHSADVNHRRGGVRGRIEQRTAGGRPEGAIDRTQRPPSQPTLPTDNPMVEMRAPRRSGLFATGVSSSELDATTLPQPSSIVVSRMAMPPIVAVLRHMWDDPAADVNPLLAPCRQHANCTCEPLQVTSRGQMRDIAAAKQLPTDVDGRLTDDGFELLAECLFGPDLQAVHISDPLDPLTHRMFHQWRQQRYGMRQRRCSCQAAAVSSTAKGPVGIASPPSPTDPTTTRPTAVAEPDRESTMAVPAGQPDMQSPNIYHCATLADLGASAIPAIRTTAIGAAAITAPLTFVFVGLPMLASVSWIAAGITVARTGANLRHETMGYRTLDNLATATILTGLAGILAGLVAAAITPLT